MTGARMDSRRSARSIAQVVLLTASLVLLLLGDVLAFNQLATQSATDAILQLIVFAIGGAGIFECLRRALCSDSALARGSALIPGLLGLAALISWRTQAPIGWFVALTVGATIFLGVITVRSLWGPAAREGSESAQLVGLLCLAQTIVFAYVAAFAAIDAGPALFG